MCSDVLLTTVSSESYTLNKYGGYLVTRANIKHLTRHKNTKGNSVITLCTENRCLTVVCTNGFV